MPRALGPPPDERPNWAGMNEGQKRYAYEQYNLARVRRGLPIDHPIPVLDSPPEERSDTPPSPEPPELPEEEPIDVDSQPVPANQELFRFPPMAPATPGSKRGADEVSSTSSASKRTGSIFPGTGENSAPPMSLENEDALIEIPRPFELNQSSIRVYKKVHRFLTYGIAYTDLGHKYSYQSTAPVTSYEAESRFMCTPMAYIPWDHDFFYLNPSEWELLPEGARMISCNVKIRSDNIRIAFPTNASDTELATLNQNKFIRVGKGLAQNTPSVNVKYTGFNDKKPMVPASFELFKPEHLKSMMKNMYGVMYDKNETTAEHSVPAQQFGLPMVLPNYLAIVNMRETGYGWPQFQSYVEEYNAENMQSKLICEMSYKPKIGLLKKPAPSIFTGWPNVKVDHTRNIKIGTGPYDPRGIITTFRDKNAQPVETTGNAINRDNPTSIIDYGTVIEKSQAFCKGLFTTFPPQSQPSLHVGVQPVASLTTKNINTGLIDNWTDCQGYFEVEATCAVDCNYATLRPFADFVNVMPHDEYRHFKDCNVKLDKSMYYGLYQNQ